MRDEIVLSPAEAMNLLRVRDGSVHCQIQQGMIFTGADWPKKEVEKCFKESKKIEIGGPNCLKMGHGIVVHPDKEKYYQSDLRFFEHDTEKVKLILNQEEK